MISCTLRWLIGNRNPTGVGVTGFPNPLLKHELSLQARIVYDDFYFYHTFRSHLMRRPSFTTSLRLSRLSLLPLLLPPAVLAHEYWIERGAGSYVLQQGHRTSAHAGTASVAYDPAIVRRIDCADEAGKARPLAAAGNPVRAEGDCASVRMALDSGYWTKTPYDTFNKPRNEVKGALESWRSEESVTRIDRWSAIPPPRTGLALSLPANPAALKAGDKFVVVATLDGTPRADVPVAYDGETRGATDAEGRINLRVRRSGLQQISASIETPLADGKADKLIRGATLNFLLP